MAAQNGSDEKSEGQMNRYLSFRLGDEEFGVEILRVREIIGIIDITPLPKTPDFVRGAINLRGQIIPVIEMRMRFGLCAREFTEQTCIVVMEVPDSSGERMIEMGAIVDEVCEVLDISPDMVDASARLAGGSRSDQILGMAKVDGRVIALLAIDATLASNHISQMPRATDGLSAKEADYASSIS